MHPWSLMAAALGLATAGIVVAAPAAVGTCTVSVMGSCDGQCTVNVLSSCEARASCTVNAVYATCNEGASCTINVFASCTYPCDADVSVLGPCAQVCRVWIAGCIV